MYIKEYIITEIPNSDSIEELSNFEIFTSISSEQQQSLYIYIYIYPVAHSQTQILE